MKIGESAGPSTDQDTWSQILATSDDTASHKLWASVIETVAKSVVEKTSSMNVTAQEEDVDELARQLIETWLADSIPSSHNIAFVLGELDYFYDLDCAWDETINFSGPPCGYSDSVVSDLHESLEFYPDAQEAITESEVQTFFSFWRSRFFKHVLHAAHANNT